jgi:hypothetical protein
MASFNDPQRLAHAVNLARPFNTGQARAHRHDKKLKALRVTGVFSHLVFMINSDHNKRLGTQDYYVAVGFVPPSKRQYGDDALEKGWQIGQLKDEDTVIGQAVLDFLSRNDQEPASAATPKLTVSVETTSETAGSFANPRSPTTANGSTPITPMSLIAEPEYNDTSPEGGFTKQSDEHATDELIDLLNTFSFRDKEVEVNSSGHMMDRFLKLLAQKVDIAQHRSEEKQSCVKQRNNSTACSADEGKIKNLQKDDTATKDPPSSKTDQASTVTEKAMPVASKDQQLRPQAPVYVPPKSMSAEGDTPDYTLAQTSAFGNDAEQAQLPFTGQFGKPSGDAPQGYWPAMKIVVPETPLTYTIWIPVEYPVPQRTPSSTMIPNRGQDVVSTSRNCASQPMRGLSVSRWAKTQSLNRSDHSGEVL